MVRAMTFGRALTPVFEDATASMLFAENLAFVVWRGAPEAEHVRRWHRFALEHGKGPHAPGLCVDIIVRGTPRFSDEMRQETNRFASDTKVFPRGMAHVVLVGGLVGSAVRAFIGTVILVTKPVAPAKVFGDLDTASRWVLPLLAGTRWTAAEIRNLAVEAANRPAPPNF